MTARRQAKRGRGTLEFADVGHADDGPLLKVEDLHTWFRTSRGTVKAVDGVSLSVDQGQTLGIVGESGSGKTVLSRSIMGLLPVRDVVRSGTVHFAGHELTAMKPDQLRQVWGAELSMIFQDPMTALNPVKRIGRQVTESLRLHLDIDRAEATAMAIELFRSVGIPSPEQRVRWYPFQLSGGMRQRVMIAIALACAPRLVMADEPTTGLDVTVQAQILDLLGELQRERHMAVILVTHDLGVVASRADEIVVMYAGRIVEQAPTRTLFSDTRMPYTRALMDSIPRLADPSGVRLHAIAGRPPDMIHPPRGCRFAPRCPYVQDKCREIEPPLRTAGSPDHLFACWFPLVNGVSTAPMESAGAGAPPTTPATSARAPIPFGDTAINPDAEVQSP
ncbi:MAG TPA: ABC transporter ATP-binding protein [Acidimicrobiales bacterium]|nr:ABC transporter ATP-binding protein [Acidimicrobiales bacterium]